MKKLAVKYNNIEFQNPYILASAPPTRNAEMIARAFDLGWAGAVTKTICLNYKEMSNTSPRLYAFKGGSSTYGLQNIELISDKSPQEWIKEIKFLKEAYPEKIIIASISAEANNLSGWQELSQMMQNAGADILELNLSCPHGLPELGMGRACCEVPDISAKITKAVKEVSDIPVWVKLSASVNDINYLAKLCLLSGADGITAINTVRGFAGIDIETGIPNFNVDGKSTFGGLSGKIIKPIALQAVAEIASSNNCFISASGGINSWQDAVEFALLGASTTQICTKVMLEGYDVISSLLSGLNNYLERHNYNSFQEITGKSLKNLSLYENLNKKTILNPVINKKTCIKCGKCYVSCLESGYQSINFRKESFPEVIPEKCSGCGLCKLVCPANSINFQNNTVPAVTL